MSGARAPALLCILALASTTVWATPPADPPVVDEPTTTTAPVELEVQVDGVRSLQLARTPSGRFVYEVAWNDGRTERLDPDTFSEIVYERYQGRPLPFLILNITSWGNVAWVVLGLLGQVLFSGRMIVQWLTSERKRRSVVPVAFWWMSLGGATMLLVYFVWRKDIVGVLGQSTGWLIYSRNLWLIYRERRAGRPAGPHPDGGVVSDATRGRRRPS